MSYDRRTAGTTSTLYSFLRNAQEDFLGEVLTMLQGNRYFTKLKVINSAATAFLEFSGANRAKMTFEGYLSIIPFGGSDARVVFDVDSEYSGKDKWEQNYKLALLDVRTAANIVLHKLGIDD